MHTPTSANPQGIPQQPASRPEETDVSVRGVLIFLGILAVTAVIIHFGLWLMQRHLDTRETHLDRQITQHQVKAPAARGIQGFPEPRLQTAPALDMAAFRAREESELNSYGWVNRTAGVVRIPIQKAMELIAQRGLPVRDVTEQGKSNLELMKERVEKR
jgi:hypothetical protein